MKKSYIKILILIAVLITVALIIKGYKDYTLDCNEEDELCKSNKWFFKSKYITTKRNDNGNITKQ